MPKKSKPDLPDWALTHWEALGKPDIADIQDVLTGPLFDRRAGLRRDDLVEITLDARALQADAPRTVCGRMVGFNKSSIEILDSEGNYRFIVRDVIVELRLIAHMRPAYIDDTELLEFEREDQKRRSKLHESAEKKTKGTDDAHLWG